MCCCQVAGLPGWRSRCVEASSDVCCCLKFCNRSSNWTSRSSVQVNGGVHCCLKNSCMSVAGLDFQIMCAVNAWVSVTVSSELECQVGSLGVCT